MEPIKFVHCADLHLGYKQYGLQERFKDFFLSFDQVVDYLLNKGIKTLLISGDVFHKKDLAPETLQWFQDRLEILKNNSISVFVIEGNHDNKHKVNDQSWLEYLSHNKYIDLVNQRTIVPGDTSLPSIVGMKYFGASTKVQLEKLYDVGVEGNVLMLHAGVVGQIPNTGNIKPEDLLRFKDRFDYIALGHIHKPYIIDDLIFNPGSIENCSISESEFNGGFFDVTIDGDGVHAEHIPTKKRPMVRANFDVERGVYIMVTQEPMKNTILEITLIGETEKKPDSKKLKVKFLKDNEPFHLIVKDHTTRTTQTIDFHGNSREDIERAVLSEMTDDDDITTLIMDLKDSIDDEPEMIYKKFDELFRGGQE